MSSLKELYRSSLKKIHSEELFDLFIFRPLGFVIAYSLRKTFITPNHITLLAMGFGIASGFSYYFFSYWLGALLLFLSNTLDCADGQLARIRKSSSKVGMILDGFADYVTYVAVYFGIGFALIRDTGNFDYFWLGWIAGISTILQTMVFDEYRNRYLRKDSTLLDMEKEIQEFQQLLQNTKKIREKVLFFLYSLYLKRQFRIRKAEKQPLLISDQWIRLLSFVGSTTHITLIILFSFIPKIDRFAYYFLFISVPINLYLFIILSLQNKMNKKNRS